MTSQNVAERCWAFTKRANHIVWTQCAVHTPNTCHFTNKPNLTRIEVQFRIMIHRHMPYVNVLSGFFTQTCHKLCEFSVWVFLRCNRHPSEIWRGLACSNDVWRAELLRFFSSMICSGRIFTLSLAAFLQKGSICNLGIEGLLAVFFRYRDNFHIFPLGRTWLAPFKLFLCLRFCLCLHSIRITVGLRKFLSLRTSDALLHISLFFYSHEDASFA